MHELRAKNVVIGRRSSFLQGLCKCTQQLLEEGSDDAQVGGLIVVISSSVPEQ